LTRRRTSREATARQAEPRGPLCGPKRKLTVGGLSRRTCAARRRAGTIAA
jgi:hypothetical protein